jgi:hypothetical protein
MRKDQNNVVVVAKKLSLSFFLNLVLIDSWIQQKKLIIALANQPSCGKNLPWISSIKGI